MEALRAMRRMSALPNDATTLRLCRHAHAAGPGLTDARHGGTMPSVVAGGLMAAACAPVCCAVLRECVGAVAAAVPCAWYPGGAINRLATSGDSGCDTGSAAQARRVTLGLATPVVSGPACQRWLAAMRQVACDEVAGMCAGRGVRPARRRRMAIPTPGQAVADYPMLVAIAPIAVSLANWREAVADGASPERYAGGADAVTNRASLLPAEPVSKLVCITPTVHTPIDHALCSSSAWASPDSL
jgi:hypothetical protein